MRKKQSPHLPQPPRRNPRQSAAAGGTGGVAAGEQVRRLANSRYETVKRLERERDELRAALDAERCETAILRGQLVSRQIALMTALKEIEGLRKEIGRCQ